MRIVIGERGGTWVPDQYALLGAKLWEFAVYHLERTEGRAFPREFLEQVEELRRVGEARAAQLASQAGSREVPEDTAPVIVDDEKLLTSTEAAARAQISKRAINQAAQDGRLFGRMIGGRWMFEEVVIDEFIVARRAAA